VHTCARNDTQLTCTRTCSLVEKRPPTWPLALDVDLKYDNAEPPVDEGTITSVLREAAVMLARLLDAATAQAGHRFLVTHAQRVTSDTHEYKCGFHLYCPTILVNDQTILRVRRYLIGDADNGWTGAAGVVRDFIREEIGVGGDDLRKIFDIVLLGPHHQNGLRVIDAPKFTQHVNADGARVRRMRGHGRASRFPEAGSVYAWNTGIVFDAATGDVTETSTMDRADVIRMSFLRRRDGHDYTTHTPLDDDVCPPGPAPAPPGPAPPGPAPPGPVVDPDEIGYVAPPAVANLDLNHEQWHRMRSCDTVLDAYGVLRRWLAEQHLVVQHISRWGAEGNIFALDMGRECPWSTRPHRSNTWYLTLRTGAMTLTVGCRGSTHAGGYQRNDAFPFMPGDVIDLHNAVFRPEPETVSLYNTDVSLRQLSHDFDPQERDVRAVVREINRVAFKVHGRMYYQTRAGLQSCNPTEVGTLMSHFTIAGRKKTRRKALLAWFNSRDAQDYERIVYDRTRPHGHNGDEWNGAMRVAFDHVSYTGDKRKPFLALFQMLMLCEGRADYAADAIWWMARSLIAKNHTMVLFRGDEGGGKSIMINALVSMLRPEQHRKIATSRDLKYQNGQEMVYVLTFHEFRFTDADWSSTLYELIDSDTYRQPLIRDASASTNNQLSLIGASNHTDALKSTLHQNQGRRFRVYETCWDVLTLKGTAYWTDLIIATGQAKEHPERKEWHYFLATLRIPDAFDHRNAPPGTLGMQRQSYERQSHTERLVRHWLQRGSVLGDQTPWEAGRLSATAVREAAKVDTRQDKYTEVFSKEAGDLTRALFYCGVMKKRTRKDGFVFVFPALEVARERWTKAMGSNFKIAGDNFDPDTTETDWLVEMQKLWTLLAGDDGTNVADEWTPPAYLRPILNHSAAQEVALRNVADVLVRARGNAAVPPLRRPGVSPQYILSEGDESDASLEV